MHYGNFTKLERKKSPFSLRERYFSTHFLGLWKMRRNDLLIYSFSHRIETTFSLNSNLMKILRKLIFKVGYCLNNVEIFHVEYPSQYSQKTWFFFTLTISIYQSAHKLRNKLIFVSILADFKQCFNNETYYRWLQFPRVQCKEKPWLVLQEVLRK